MWLESKYLKDDKGEFWHSGEYKRLEIGDLVCHISNTEELVGVVISERKATYKTNDPTKKRYFYTIRYRIGLTLEHARGALLKINY